MEIFNKIETPVVAEGGFPKGGNNDSKAKLGSHYLPVSRVRWGELPGA